MSSISSVFSGVCTKVTNNFKENLKIQSTAGKVARVAGTLTLAGAAVAAFLLGSQALILAGLSTMVSTAIAYGTGLTLSALSVSIPLAMIAVRHPKAQQDVLPPAVELTHVVSQG